MFKKLCVASLLLTAPTVANASLMLNITEDNIGGGTIWEFSGSTLAIGSDTFSHDDFVDAGEAWSNLQFDLTVMSDLNATVSSGAAWLTIAGETRDIEYVYIDDDGVVGDEFGIDVSGGEFAFSDGDMISWMGTITVDSISISDFLVSGFSITDFSTFAGSQIALDVTIGNAVNVAEPSTFGIISLGLLGFGISRRKKHS